MRHRRNPDNLYPFIVRNEWHHEYADKDDKSINASDTDGAIEVATKILVEQFDLASYDFFMGIFEDDHVINASGSVSEIVVDDDGEEYEEEVAEIAAEVVTFLDHPTEGLHFIRSGATSEFLSLDDNQAAHGIRWEDSNDKFRGVGVLITVERYDDD
ncbi:MAG: hypothetical protein Q8O94_02815 [bacterium]|nr:hypothetical protein [bacterium]